MDMFGNQAGHGIRMMQNVYGVRSGHEWVSQGCFEFHARFFNPAMMSGRLVQPLHETSAIVLQPEHGRLLLPAGMLFGTVFTVMPARDAALTQAWLRGKGCVNVVILQSNEQLAGVDASLLVVPDINKEGDLETFVDEIGAWLTDEALVVCGEAQLDMFTEKGWHTLGAMPKPLTEEDDDRPSMIGVFSRTATTIAPLVVPTGTVVGVDKAEPGAERTVRTRVSFDPEQHPDMEIEDVQVSPAKPAPERARAVWRTWPDVEKKDLRFHMFQAQTFYK